MPETGGLDRTAAERYWALRRSQIDLINGLGRRSPVFYIVLVAVLTGAMTGLLQWWWRDDAASECIKQHPEFAVEFLYGPEHARRMCELYNDRR